MFMRTSINVVREHASIFFKQKTAYEMRISDWSSDVCSSDLSGAAGGAGTVTVGRSPPAGFHVSARPSASVMRSTHAGAPPTRSSALSRPTGRTAASREIVAHRSEEHTSELQSLMRISYAVFCLTNKTNLKHKPTSTCTTLCTPDTTLSTIIL